MGYFFSLLYLLTAYLTPPILFGPLSDYHIEIVIVLIAIITSIPNLSGSGLGRAPQTLALVGIAFAILLSVAQSGWLGGVVGPLYSFLQPAFAFFLVAVNFRRKRHFVCIVAALVVSSAFFIYMGVHDLQNGIPHSQYLYGEGTLRRLRGLGFVNDPNDLSQVLVSLIPCVFLWRRKILVLDLFLIGIPLALLVTGMYLTHSRGAMLAMTAVVLFAARRKIGLIPASIVAGALVAASLALGWSGGRDISMDAGADRLDLWYDGMESLKAHPLFGIGLNQFSDKFGITAHNSVIICASELGAVGLFFWLLLIVSSVFTAASATSDKSEATRASLIEDDVPAEQTSLSQWGPYKALAAHPEILESHSSMRPHQELTYGYEDPDASYGLAHQSRDIQSILLIAVVGMLTAGWFLSRALSIWLFMYFGMVYAASRMNTVSSETTATRLPFLLRWSAIATLGSIALMYVILRARNVL